jgi:hypothetical protein
MTLRTLLTRHMIPARAARGRFVSAGCVAALAFGGLVGVNVFGAQAASAATTKTTVAPCTTEPEATPFAAWGDDSDYFLVPNGDFAQGGTDWRLTGGASVVNGGEPFGVVAGDSHSVAIPNGAQAVSEPQCLAIGEEDVRMFLNNPGVPGSILHVDAQVTNPLTGLTFATTFNLNSSAMPTGWGPSPTLVIPNLLGGLLDGILGQDLTLTFTTQGTPATWNIDDVFVDPFKSR